MTNQPLILVTLGSEAFDIAQNTLRGLQNSKILRGDPEKVPIVPISLHDGALAANQQAVNLALTPEVLLQYLTESLHAERVGLAQRADVNALQGNGRLADEVRENKMLGRLYLWHTANLEKLRRAFVEALRQVTQNLGAAATPQVVVVASLDATRYCGILPELGYVLRAMASTPIRVSVLFWTIGDGIPPLAQQDALYEINHYSHAGASWPPALSKAAFGDKPVRPIENGQPYDELAIVLPEANQNSVLEALIMGAGVPPKITPPATGSERTHLSNLCTVFAARSLFVPFDLVMKEWRHHTVVDTLNLWQERSNGVTMEETGFRTALERVYDNARTGAQRGHRGIDAQIEATQVDNQLYEAVKAIVTTFEQQFAIDPGHGLTTSMAGKAFTKEDYLYHHATTLEAFWHQKLMERLFVIELLDRGGPARAQSLLALPGAWKLGEGKEIEQELLNRATQSVLRAGRQVHALLEQLRNLGKRPVFIMAQRRAAWETAAAALKNQLVGATNVYVSEGMGLCTLAIIQSHVGLRKEVSGRLDTYLMPLQHGILVALIMFTQLREKEEQDLREVQEQISRSGALPLVLGHLADAARNAIASALQEATAENGSIDAIRKQAFAVLKALSSGDIASVNFENPFTGMLASYRNLITSIEVNALGEATLKLLKDPTIAGEMVGLRGAFEAWVNDDAIAGQVRTKFHPIGDLYTGRNVEEVKFAVMETLGHHATLGENFAERHALAFIQYNGLTVHDLDSLIWMRDDTRLEDTRPFPQRHSRRDVDWLDPRAAKGRDRVEALWLLTLLLASTNASWLKQSGTSYIVVPSALLNAPDEPTVLLPKNVASAIACLVRAENLPCLEGFEAYVTDTLSQIASPEEKSHTIRNALANFDVSVHDVNTVRARSLIKKYSDGTIDP